MMVEKYIFWHAWIININQWLTSSIHSTNKNRSLKEVSNTVPGCGYSMVNKTLIHDLMEFTT